MKFPVHANDSLSPIISVLNTEIYKKKRKKKEQYNNKWIEKKRKMREVLDVTNTSSKFKFVPNQIVPEN